MVHLELEQRGRSDEGSAAAARRPRLRISWRAVGRHPGFVVSPISRQGAEQGKGAGGSDGSKERKVAEEGVHARSEG
jgi:hypothetical protein